MQDLEFYRHMLVNAYDENVKRVLLYIIRSLAKGKPIELNVIDRILTKAYGRATTAARELATLEARRFLVLTEINLNPLKAFIKERNEITRRGLAGYKKSLEPLTGDFSRVKFGRRGQDLIRDIGLRNVERGILHGSIERSRHELIQELREKVKPINGKFFLEIAPYNGHYKQFDVRYYADLVARTTRREAQNVANTMKAEELGTRLVKFNYTGKNYLALNDPCAIIDGKTYSIEPGGTWINNKFFPYWRDAIKSGFAVPHPNCSHFLRPVSESLVDQLEPGATYAQFAKFGGFRRLA